MRYWNIFFLTILFLASLGFIYEGQFFNWTVAITLCAFYDAFSGWKYSE